MSNNTDNNTFDFNSPLPPPDAFELVPEGDARFIVMDMKRVQKERGKLGTVWIAELKLRVVPMNGESDKPMPMSADVVLHPTLAFLVYQFFAAIGQYQHGSKDPFKPNWNAVVGSEGYCVVKHRPWTNKDGEQRVQAEIKAWLDSKGRSSAKDEPRNMQASF